MVRCIVDLVGVWCEPMGSRCMFWNTDFLLDEPELSILMIRYVELKSNTTMADQI